MEPAGVVSVSIWAICGFGAHHHLRQSFTFINVPAMAQPEVYIGNAADLFDREEKIFDFKPKLGRGIYRQKRY